MAGIPIIQGFEVSKAAPIDSRFVAADATERAAIYWAYAGLLCYQVDNDTLYKYNGTTWDAIANTGPQGTPGSVWYNGSGVPSNGTGINGDYYVNNLTGDYYQKAAGVWGTALGNLKGPQGLSGIGPGDHAQLHVELAASPQSLTTSYSLLTQFTTEGIYNGAVPSAASSKITINNSGKYYLFFNADVIGVINKQYQITAYVGGVASAITMTFDTTSNSTPHVAFSGVIDIPTSPVDIEIYAKCITGTNDLTIVTGRWGVAGLNVKGDAGVAGKALIHTANDITLTEALISTVEGGSYTPVNPYAASVLSDNRVNITAPTALSGNKTGHSISYNGTVWNSNGIWRGPTGPQGATGATGPAGVSPTNHFTVIQNTEVGGAGTSFSSSAPYTFAATLNPSGTLNQWVNTTGKIVNVRIVLRARVRKTSALGNNVAVLTISPFLAGFAQTETQGRVLMTDEFTYYVDVVAELILTVGSGITLAWRGRITAEGATVLGVPPQGTVLATPKWLVHIIT